MEDQAQAQTQIQTQTPGSPRSQCLERNNEPVRSRWTPKPEQILILESIFNSGMVNPPKEETVKIRKLLEKFGSVGDANVFYWFQNRRSRSRRRQRQIQASLISAGSIDQQQQQQQQPMIARCANNSSRGGVIEYQDSASYPTATQGFVIQQPAGILPMLQSSSPLAGSSSCSSWLNGVDEIYSISGHASCFPEIDHNTSLPSSFLHIDNTSKVHYEFGRVSSN